MSDVSIHSTFSRVDSKVWTELAHNTSGWVVPVMSANVHELRAYNRLAGMARGGVVVVFQVSSLSVGGCMGFGVKPSPLNVYNLPPHTHILTDSPIQDDEVPPSGCNWVRDVVAIFRRHPKLGALGLRNYRLNRASGSGGICVCLGGCFYLCVCHISSTQIHSKGAKH